MFRSYHPIIRKSPALTYTTHPSSSFKVTSPRTTATRHGAHERRIFMIAMSLRGLPRASIALRSSCRGNVSVGRLTQQRWASEEKKSGKEEEKPFYFQLQESIYERVQKEKAEQYRIQSLQQRTARGQFWATMSCMFFHNQTHSHTSERAVLIRTNSNIRRPFNRLLLRPKDSSEDHSHLHRSPRRHRPAQTQHLRSEHGSRLD